MIDLAHHFQALALAEREHEAFLRVMPDPLTMANDIRDAGHPQVATAAAIKDAWATLDFVFNEDRSITAIAKDLVEKYAYKDSTYATAFHHATKRLSEAAKRVDERFRSTLSSHSRAMMSDELACIRAVLDAIDKAQAALVAAHAVHESMLSPAGGKPLAIAFT